LRQFTSNLYLLNIFQILPFASFFQEKFISKFCSCYFLKLFIAHKVLSEPMTCVCGKFCDEKILKIDFQRGASSDDFSCLISRLSKSFSIFCLHKTSNMWFDVSFFLQHSWNVTYLSKIVYKMFLYHNICRLFWIVLDILALFHQLYLNGKMQLLYHQSRLL